MSMKTRRILRSKGFETRRLDLTPEGRGGVMWNECVNRWKSRRGQSASSDAEVKAA
jgi:hypothetical protein